MDARPVRLPLALVTLCMPLVLLLARVGPGPLAAPPRRSPGLALAQGAPPPSLAGAERNPLLPGPQAPADGGADAPRVERIEMPPLTIVGDLQPTPPARPADARREGAAPSAAGDAGDAGDAGGAGGAGDAVGAGGAKRGLAGLLGRVNLNTATAVELALLPGMGPKRASAVIALRTRRPLRRPRDVMRVRGIGRRTWRKWRNHLAVDGETTLRRGSGTAQRRTPPMPPSARGDPR